MNAEIMKSFLVSLGFQVDQKGAMDFDRTLWAVTDKAVKLGVAVETAALSVVAFTTKIASGLDNLYWMSQRTGATVTGIKQIGYAVSQMGGSVDGARSSLESLSRFVRNNPGAEGFLNRLGVQTRNANGQMRDMASIFTGVGQRLSSMPYYRANMYAQMLGIDENTLMAMRRGVGQFSAQYSAMTKAIGFNADQAAISSNRFMTSLRTFGEMAGMARDKIGSSLTDGLSGSLDRLRKQILDNFPKIERGVTVAVKGILWLGDAIGRLVYRLVQAAGDIQDWWNRLDKGTQQLIELFGGLLVAWRLLNSAFLTSPIGIITTLAAAILLLYDDYRTWKEGGKSLIDWGKWKPGIDATLKALTELKNSIRDTAKEIAALLNIDLKNWTLKGDIENLTKQFGEFGKMMSMIGDLINALKDGNWTRAYAIGKQLLAQGGEQADAMPAVTASGNDAAEWIKGKTGFDPRSVGRTIRGWFGGGEDAQQYGQSVKRPQPTASGAALLGWMQPAFQQLEQLYRLPEGLLRSVAVAESSGDQFAVSGAGAKGLFQFMPDTARDMGLKGNDVFDPLKSADAAARYLGMLLRRSGGDLGKALASYNWGMGNVERYGMGLLPQETRNYIPRVMSNMPSGSTTVHQQNTYNIYGGNAAEIGDHVGRQVGENAVNIDISKQRRLY